MRVERMSNDKPRIAKRMGRGDHVLSDGSLVITLKGTNQPYCKIKPGYEPFLGPHVAVYRMHESGEEDRVLTIGAGGVGSIVRWLPIVLSSARRLENEALRKAPKAKKRG